MAYNWNIRPYIVINGTDSRSIPGLIITKLPPITRPPMRTRTETIDGRDGDIVTTLGYSAYDKTIEIGLANEYNEDDIIRYFTQSGRVIFGSEPDKYYLFSCYDNINLEKLLRFRTGKINLHCQPFKYSDSEGELFFSWNKGRKEAFVRNNGNYFSRPKIIINGYGRTLFGINNNTILDIDFPSSGASILIDPVNMEASYTSGGLANRLVKGDYDKIKLEPGENIITLNGSGATFSIREYSRWL